MKTALRKRVERAEQRAAARAGAAASLYAEERKVWASLHEALSEGETDPAIRARNTANAQRCLTDPAWRPPPPVGICELALMAADELPKAAAFHGNTGAP